MSELLDQAREIAVDEVAWRAQHGFTPTDVFWSLGQHAPPFCGWNDALNALVSAWLRLQDSKPSASVVPLRDRKGRWA